jgi:hypothetical protein
VPKVSKEFKVLKEDKVLKVLKVSREFKVLKDKMETLGVRLLITPLILQLLIVTQEQVN